MTTRETQAEKRTRTVALPPNVRFDDGDALLKDWDSARAPRLEFDGFDIDAMQVEHVVIEATGAADATGKTPALRKRFAKGAMLNATRILVGRDGRIVEARHPMSGTVLVIKAADRDTHARPAPRLSPAAQRDDEIALSYPAAGDLGAYALPLCAAKRDRIHAA